MEIDERAARLDSLLAAASADAVWLAQPDSFAWVTGGGDNRVDRDSSVGDAAVGYFGDGEWQVVTNSIEAERLAAEQLPAALSMSVTADPWHEADLAASVAARSPESALADFDVPGLSQFDPTRLRLRLSDDDVRRYRALGHEVATVVERVCRNLQSADTEREAASGIRVGLTGRGIEAPVLLVGGDERAQSYRHPTPTTAQLGSYAMVVVTARRGGLYASLSRLVAFDPPEWLAERQAVAQRVEMAALAATREVAADLSPATPDADSDSSHSDRNRDRDRDSEVTRDDGALSTADAGTAGEVFDAIRQAYADEGYEGEWREHHQGGATGYAGREWVATPDSRAPVVAPAAYAWNPTVGGAKSEDTVLVRDGDVELLTATGGWPTTVVSVDGFALERPDVLE
ncbi:MAG: M24 family metallopeptidase, partial [Halobaculum sp.]